MTTQVQITTTITTPVILTTAIQDPAAYAIVTSYGAALGGISGAATNPWKIKNQGSIAAPGYGIALADGGLLLNGNPTYTGATVSGPGGGAQFGGGAGGNIVNFGTIKGKAANGLAIANGGTVRNLGTYAVVAGGHDGILATNTADVFILNQGSIGGATYRGIDIPGSAGATVTNIGSISGPANGVFIGGSGTLGNSGRISASTGHAVSLASGAVHNTGTIIGGADGVILGGAAVLTNFGTTALITGHTDGVRADSSTSFTLSNQGNILGNTLAGIDLRQGNLANIANAGTIHGAHDGIYSQAEAKLVITNRGAVSGTYRAVEVQAGGDSTVTNIGTIAGGSNGVFIGAHGTVTNQGFIAATSGAGGAGVSIGGGAINNRGTIKGGTAGANLGSGATRLTNATPGALIEGHTDGVHVTNAIGFTLSNSAAITGDGAAGVNLQGGSLSSIFNAGTISGHTAGIVLQASDMAGNYGVVLSAGTAILAAGNALINNGIGNTTARITGGTTGIQDTAGILVVNNTGSIDAPSTAIAAAGLMLDNAASGLIGGLAINAIIAGATQISNSGTILGAVQVSGGGTISNLPGATILAAAVGTRMPNGIIDSGTAGLTIDNYGSIGNTGTAATVVFNSTGANTLIAHAGSHLAGGGALNLVGNGPNDALRLANDSTPGTLDPLTARGIETIAVDPGATWSGGTENFTNTNSVLIGAAGRLTATGNWSFSRSLAIGGTFAIAATGRVAIGGTVTSAPLGGLLIAAGQQLAASGTLAAVAGIDTEGTLAITAGATLAIPGAVSGAGLVRLESGALFAITGALTAAKLQFNGANATADLHAPAATSSLISGLAAGDSIDLEGLPYASTTITTTIDSTILEHVTLKFGATTASLAFDHTGLASLPLAFATDGHGGTLITWGP